MEFRESYLRCASTLEHSRAVPFLGGWYFIQKSTEKRKRVFFLIDRPPETVLKKTQSSLFFVRHFMEGEAGSEWKSGLFRPGWGTSNP